MGAEFSFEEIVLGDRVTIVAPYYESQNHLIGFSGIVTYVQAGVASASDPKRLYHVELDTPRKDINRVFFRQEIELPKRRLYGRRLQLET